MALQETKHSSGSVRAENAIARGWGTFMCGNREGRAGYSGVLLTVRDSLPVASVQHGLTGVLVSGVRGAGGPASVMAAPLAVTEEDMPPVASPPLSVPDLALDGEGRAIAVDLGFAVILCVYCPAATTEKVDRVAEVASFKARFHAAVAARARALRRAGRRVIVVGDLNVSHGPLDHMDPRDWEKRHGAPFAAAPYRRWMSGLVGTEAAMRAAAESCTSSSHSSAIAGKTCAAPSAAAAVSGAEPAFSDAPEARGSHVLLPACCVCAQSASLGRSSSSTAAVGDSDSADAWRPPPDGCTHFNDSFRRLWPHRERAYTCWHIAAGCRATNYGTRLDYAVVSADMPLVAVGDEALRQLRRPPRDGSSSSSASASSSAASGGAGAGAASAGAASAGDFAGAPTRVDSDLPAPKAAFHADAQGASASASAGADAGAAAAVSARGVHPAFPPKVIAVTPAEAALAHRYGVVVTGADIAPGYAAQHSDHCPIVLDLVVSGEVLAAARALAPQLASAHPSAANATQFALKQASLRQLWTATASASSSSASAAAAVHPQPPVRASASVPARDRPALSAGSVCSAATPADADTVDSGAVQVDCDCEIITIDDDEDDAAPAASVGKSSGAAAAASSITSRAGSASGWSIGGLAAASHKASKTKPKAVSTIASSTRASTGSSSSLLSSSGISKFSSLLGKRSAAGSLSAASSGSAVQVAAPSHAAAAPLQHTSGFDLDLDAEAIVDVDASPAFSAGKGRGCDDAAAEAAVPPPSKRRHTEAELEPDDGAQAAEVATVSAVSSTASGRGVLIASAAAAPGSSSSSGGSGLRLAMSMLTPEAPPPKCACNDVTVRRRAKATGREFFACKRPEGAPGTPGARCNYFKWASEWQEEQRQVVLQRRQAAAAAAAPR